MTGIHSLVHSQKLWALHVAKRQYLLDYWCVHAVSVSNASDRVWYRFSPSTNCLHCYFICKSKLLLLIFDCIAKTISLISYFYAFNNYKRSIDGVEWRMDPLTYKIIIYTQRSAAIKVPPYKLKCKNIGKSYTPKQTIKIRLFCINSSNFCILINCI
jgi:hypothetical protein